MDDFVNKAAKVTEMLKNAKDLLDDLHEAYEDMRDEAANNHDKKTLLDNLMIAATNAKYALCGMPRQGIPLDGPAMANELQRQLNAIHAADALPIPLDGPAIRGGRRRATRRLKPKRKRNY
jgi:hypothetical protein